MKIKGKMKIELLELSYFNTELQDLIGKEAKSLFFCYTLFKVLVTCKKTLVDQFS